MKTLRGDSGQTLVVVAVFMGLIALGFLAFALDVGTLFSQKRMAQAAADAAAVAAAEEASTNPSNEQNVANAMAKLNGFDTTLATNPASVTLVPLNSWNSVNSSYLQATVSKPVPTVFLGAFTHRMATMTVSATAIAGGGQTSQTCLCLQGTSGKVIDLSGSAKLIASGCGIVDDSADPNAVGIVGSASLDAVSLGIASTSWVQASNVGGGGSITPATRVVTGAPRCSVTMPVAPAYSGCVADPGGSWGTFVWGPSSASGTVCYTALTVGANGSTCTLNPGTYVITTGQLHFVGNGGYSNLGGNGVFFYLTGTASLVIDNGANVNLVAGGMTQAGGGTAPTVGAYNGITVYQATADSAAMSIQGGSSSYMNGGLYAPSASILAGNAGALTINGGIVANSLSMTGSGKVTLTSADTNEGSLSFGTPKLVQ